VSVGTDISPAEPRAVDPGAASGPPRLEPRPKSLRSGLRLNIRGRPVTLRGIHAPPGGALRWLALLGPGLVAAIAGDDAGGIATYASVGAKLGYDLLWLLLLITPALAIVQETCARLGAATGRGLLDLVRERYGIGWAVFAVGVVLLANGGVLVTEFAGVGAAAELFGVSRLVAIPLAAAAVGFLVIAGSYTRVEKAFLAMALVFFAYPIAALLARPSWLEVARGALVPSLHLGGDGLALAVALLGTTITPYMQLFQQSSTVEKGVARRHYSGERIDAYAGAIFSNLVAGFIVIATAATLHARGATDIQSAADAAQALRPAAGDAATGLFAVGLLGASLLAAGVLPLATAYAASEAFGFRKGVELDFRRAPIFFGIFSALIVTGAAIALIPGVPLIALLVGVQVLNGVLLPVVLVFLMLLSADPLLMDGLRNSRLQTALGWGTVGLVGTAVALLLGTQLLGLLGIQVLGG